MPINKEDTYIELAKRQYIDRIRRQSIYSMTRDTIDLLVKFILGFCLIVFLLGCFVLLARFEREKFIAIYCVVLSLSSAISIKILHSLTKVFFDIADSIIDLNFRTRTKPDLV